MFAESVQEDIFRENEFVETRFRGRLLPVWVKLLMGISAFTAIILVSAIIYLLVTSGQETGTWWLLMFFLIAGALIAGLAARILLLLEKRWSITAVVIAAGVNLFLLGFVLATAKISSTGDIVMAAFVSVLTAIELIFLIRLIVIFKRWRSYMSERNNR